MGDLTDEEKQALVRMQKRQQIANAWHLGGWFAGFVVSTISLLWLPFGFLPFLIVITSNIYLALMLVECAKRASSTPKGQRWFLPLPSKVSGLGLMPLILASIVVAFADLYVEDGTVQENAGSTDCNGPVYLSEPTEAVYFSAVTITTLGYGEYVPSKNSSQLLVIWELASGVLVILFVLPLVVGRLTDIDPPDQN